MNIRIIPGVLMLSIGLFVLQSHARDTDSGMHVDIDSVAITVSVSDRIRYGSSQVIEIADKNTLRENFTGNFIQTLQQIPGVRSMDIGSGFSKPVIRGMGFNRVAVLENGIKQEGQQWGADHGLEIDAFNAEYVIVRKGPSSLMYGSDAMGGTIEISPAPAPGDNQIFGEAVILGKSVNENLGGSIMLAIKKNRFYSKLRYSEQHYGDYRIPADTVIYLTQKLPVHGRRMKNTAGFERNASLYSEFRNNGYYTNIAVSNAYQKMGFFPGAHGIPDASRLEDDGKSRNIDLPYSTVNHFKITNRHQYLWEAAGVTLDLGYQNNHRGELSEFHTHYGSQLPPENNPDRELLFKLNTFSSSVKIKFYGSDILEHNTGWDVQYQDNRIDGYSFLLPQYNRFATGAYWFGTLRINDRILLTGGARYDYGRIKISGFQDGYLVDYRRESGYDEITIQNYQWRSYDVIKNFGDISGAFGIVWNVGNGQLAKINIGRSFRLPGANELASNGVHHGTFRHEQGDPSLSSERGWQLDTEYSFIGSKISFSVSPFGSWYANYIYLRPTGEWSVLPHSGQIYRYTGTQAVFAGGEVSLNLRLPLNLNYDLAGEYVYTYNLDEKIPLAFSSPASMRNTVSWGKQIFRVHAELESIATQRRVARNEPVTRGATLIHAGATLDIPAKNNRMEITFLFKNIFNKKYFNHLSFYRHVEIPEPGRNVQILLKINFNHKLK